MLDPAKRAEVEQGLAMLVEALPPIWWGLFNGCKEQGFTEAQAMQCLTVFIANQNKNS